MHVIHIRQCDACALLSANVVVNGGVFALASDCVQRSRPVRSTQS